ncbi:MAG TPA: alkaline phosphatase family protein [Mycobacteriales bacterium]|nr:alkaline phosphatase family protein [Mycobacteriales bacterium]
MDLTRRSLLAGMAAGVGALALPVSASARHAGRRPLRRPDSLPHPFRAAGTPDPAIPIEHVVVVMMENHSFDNYFGMLPARGRRAADGFSLGADARPTATNPRADGTPVRAFAMPTYCQPEHEPNQSWNGTHLAVDGGRMDGFVRASGDVAMGYWDRADIPFYYSLASTFPLANRWFASAPCQTYPNRRFLHAGTAYGLISTTTPGPDDPPPPNGTIFDRLNAYGIPWVNYFTDLPSVAIIPSTVTSNPDKLRPIAQFYADCAAGTLPAYSLVDPDFGGTDVVGGFAPDGVVPTVVRAQGQDEENPQNIRYGEQFVAQVVDAVMSSPAWDRTLLVWCYDEHGGYYDHVAPPPAIAPDSIPPALGPGDVPGGYDVYGCRVPAVVVSPWARRDYVSNVVHDHTSILAFVERKWNLPALTYRDANAAAMLDFLDFGTPSFADPPSLVAAPSPLTGNGCDTSNYPGP